MLLFRMVNSDPYRSGFHPARGVCVWSRECRSIFKDPVKGRDGSEVRDHIIVPPCTRGVSLSGASTPVHLLPAIGSEYDLTNH